jgi:hypothetical protein
MLFALRHAQVHPQRSGQLERRCAQLQYPLVGRPQEIALGDADGMLSDIHMAHSVHSGDVAVLLQNAYRSHPVAAFWLMEKMGCPAGVAT